jgi:hypothetical protein
MPVPRPHVARDRPAKARVKQGIGADPLPPAPLWRHRLVLRQQHLDLALQLLQQHVRRVRHPFVDTPRVPRQALLKAALVGGASQVAVELVDGVARGGEVQVLLLRQDLLHLCDRRCTGDRRE